MILYEVNLFVDVSVMADYCRWLDEHVQEMVKLEGFLSAKWYNDSESQEGRKKIVMHYFLRDQESMDFYLENYAPKMRQDGLDKFPGQFEATRRILHLEKEF